MNFDVEPTDWQSGIAEDTGLRKPTDPQGFVYRCACTSSS